jgi:Holliday junction resolvasome RuvABC endonuclease subunit
MCVCHVTKIKNHHLVRHAPYPNFTTSLMPAKIMNFFALDIATKTGWATNIHGKRSGTVEFAVKRGESPSMRFLRCRAWLNEMWGLLNGKIQLIAYEQAHHRGGAATAVCVGLATEVQAFAAEHDIELMPVHTATLKKFATGNGRASKSDMIRAASARGWNPQNDNEADAALLLEYAVNELKGI